MSNHTDAAELCQKNLKDAISKSKPQTIMPERIRELANQKGNVVYQWEFDEVPIKERKPVALVKQLVHAILEDYVQLRKQKPELTDPQCRFELTRNNQQYDDFWASHPKIFDTITCRTTTSRELQPIFCMIDLQEKVSSGVIKDENVAKQMFQAYAAKHFSTGMTLEQYKKEEERLKKAANHNDSGVERSIVPID